MGFPDSCLRGVPNDSYIIEDGSVGSHLFYFEDGKTSRTDEWIEQSINWEDDSRALTLIHTQRKDNGELQFKAGAARIPRDELDRLSKRPSISGLLAYERAALQTNPYHGNLLLNNRVPKLTMKKIAAGIALAVSEIIRMA